MNREMKKEMGKEMKKEKRRKWVEKALPLAIAAVLVLNPSLTVLATGTGTDTSVITGPMDSLIDIVTAIISSLGVIITLWGIAEWGIAYQSTDGGTQAHSFKRIVGGMIMVVAPQILPLLIPTA